MFARRFLSTLTAQERVHAQGGFKVGLCPLSSLGTPSDFLLKQTEHAETRKCLSYQAAEETRSCAPRTK